MRPDSLNVFDLDGTIISVNSFKEISKKLAVVLLRKLQVVALFRLIGLYIVRKLNLIPHLQFKQQVVSIFEKVLSEKEKRSIAQSVFDNNINKSVFERMLDADDCIISTTAPYAYVSRMSLRKDVVVISSLEPHNYFPDLTNFGSGKVENIQAYFAGENVRVLNFYTDSDDDQALIDFSINVFVYKNCHLTKVK